MKGKKEIQTRRAYCYIYVTKKSGKGVEPSSVQKSKKNVSENNNKKRSEGVAAERERNKYISSKSLCKKSDVCVIEEDVSRKVVTVVYALKRPGQHQP